MHRPAKSNPRGSELSVGEEVYASPQLTLEFFPALGKLLRRGM